MAYELDNDHDHNANSEPRVSAARSLAVILGALAVATGLSVMWLSELDATSSLEQAAARLGVTDASRERLREDFRYALLEFGKDTCDEENRTRAGKAAVAYYETLLEKPFTEAGLEMTAEALCQPATRRGVHPFEVLILGGRQTLPWGCLPLAWRTPVDLALQARLEQAIRSGTLTSSSLTGTLALIAQPLPGGHLVNSCRRPNKDSSRRDLPVNAAPNDDSGPRRRYRGSWW